MFPINVNQSVYVVILSQRKNFFDFNSMFQTQKLWLHFVRNMKLSLFIKKIWNTNFSPDFPNSYS